MCYIFCIVKFFHTQVQSSPPQMVYFVIKEDDQIHLNDNGLEFLSLINHNGIPLHHLKLKEGTVCMLMRNMSIKKGLVKNMRLIIEWLHHQFIQIRIMNNLTGALNQPMCIPRICFEFTPARSTWTIQRLQYPLWLAYTTTFHGCVGLTLDRTVIDMQSDVFTHGQLYTSISHVRNRTDTQLLCNNTNRPDPEHIHMTMNIVYKDLLL